MLGKISNFGTGNVSLVGISYNRLFLPDCVLNTDSLLIFTHHVSFVQVFCVGTGLSPNWIMMALASRVGKRELSAIEIL